MRYALLIYGDEDYDVSPEEWQELIDQHRQFGQEAQERGMNPGGEALQPTSTGKTVRFQQKSAVAVSDGPHAETKEQLGGFYLLDCANLDEALEMAKKLPVAAGSVEVRPLIEFD